MSEEWRVIPGATRYRVSSLGRVESRARKEPRILKACPARGGYVRVGITDDHGLLRYRMVHVLVLEAFIGPRPDLECRHLNGNPADNRLDNLAWGTRSQNNLDRVRHGTHQHAAQTHCKWGHEFTPDNTYVYTYKNGRKTRMCRTCRRKRFLEFQARKATA